jgi:hypothetical protein
MHRPNRTLLMTDDTLTKVQGKVPAPDFRTRAEASRPLSTSTQALKNWAKRLREGNLAGQGGIPVRALGRECRR